MKGLRGLLAGVLALIALQAVVGSDQAAKRAGGAVSLLAGMAERLLSPDVPAIPDRRAAAGTQPSSSTGTPTAPRPIPIRPDVQPVPPPSSTPLTGSANYA